MFQSLTHAFHIATLAAARSTSVRVTLLLALRRRGGQVSGRNHGGWTTATLISPLLGAEWLPTSRSTNVEPIRTLLPRPSMTHTHGKHCWSIPNFRTSAWILVCSDPPDMAPS